MVLLIKISVLLEVHKTCSQLYDYLFQDLMLQFWFNTFFVSGLTPKSSEGEPSMETQRFLRASRNNDIGTPFCFSLQKEDLDKANKDKKNEIYSPDFKVRMN